MEKLNKKYDVILKAILNFEKTLQALDESGDSKYYTIMRSGTFKSFDLAFDTFWKYLKIYMETKELLVINIGSPREIIKKANINGLITNQEFKILLKSLGDRNESSYTYRESVADEILPNLKLYHETMHGIIKRVEP